MCTCHWLRSFSSTSPISLELNPFECYVFTENNKYEIFIKFVLLGIYWVIVLLFLVRACPQWTSRQSQQTGTLLHQTRGHQYLPLHPIRCSGESHPTEMTATWTKMQVPSVHAWIQLFLQPMVGVKNQNQDFI